jgi:hypothetical protein
MLCLNTKTVTPWECCGKTLSIFKDVNQRRCCRTIFATQSLLFLLGLVDYFPIEMKENFSVVTHNNLLSLNYFKLLTTYQICS